MTDESRPAKSTGDLYDAVEDAGVPVAGWDEIKRCAHCGGPIKPVRGQQSQDGFGRPICSILCSMFNDEDEYAGLPDEAARSSVHDETSWNGVDTEEGRE